jgi:hypothetical protein
MKFIHVRSIACAAAFVALLMTGCAARPESPKPYDLVLVEGSEYVRNTSVRLPQEYWVVIRARGGSASMFPRPDGRPELASACETGDAFSAELKAYRLCRAATSSADLALVNALPEGTALRVSTFLHGTLRFKTTADGIDPFPYTGDLIGICERDPAARTGFLKARCDRALGYMASGQRNDVFYPWTEAERTELPARLNALYGVSN